MVGNQVAAQIDGYKVTIAGVTATVADGQTTLVGNHSISVTVASADSTRTIVLDGLTVVVKPYVEDDDGDRHSGTTVVVDSTDGVMENGTITLAGVTVTKASSGAIGISMGSASGVDANPAGIIYECLTNVIWGMGAFSGLERFPISLHRIRRWRSSWHTPVASTGRGCGRWRPTGRG